MSNPALYYIKWLVYSASDGFGNGWKKSFINLAYSSFQGNRAPKPVPSGYPNSTRYPVFLSIPDPTRFSFRNHRVAGNPKHRVLPDISGKPEVSGTTRYSGYHP